MADLPGVLMPHRVTVTPTLEGAEGPVSGAPVPDVRCRVEGRIDVTADGQHVGSLKLYARLDTRSTFTPGARVQFRDGSRGVVAAVAAHEDGGAGAWQHVEVSVTGGDL